LAWLFHWNNSRINSDEKIVITDAKMQMLHSVWNDTLVNVKNGDILESMGKIVNRLPYGELPYNLDE
jgi:hypothetical protein